MKTLIVLVLYVAFAEARYQLPIEVYEIKETNDKNLPLYVNKHNDVHSGRDEKSLLLKLLEPYKKKKISKVDKVTKDLLEKLKLNGRNKLQDYGNQNIVVIDINAMSDSNDDSSNISDGFVDETRGGHDSLASNLLYHIIPRKVLWNKVANQHQALRTYDDRTTAPRHRYPYEEDY